MEVGTALLKEAPPLLTGTDRAFDRVRRAAVSERQTLSVGFIPSVGNHLIRPLFRASSQTYPKSSFRQARRRHGHHAVFNATLFILVLVPAFL